MGGICSLTDSINFLFKEHPLSTPCMPTIVPKKTGTVPVNINSNILGTQICKQTNITLGMLDLASFFLPSFLPHCCKRAAQGQLLSQGVNLKDAKGRRCPKLSSEG